MIEYTQIKRHGRTALVCASETERIAAALLEGAGCVPAESEGRGAVLLFELPDGKGCIRRYQRGGFIHSFVKESYLLVNRPFREFRVHQHLFGKGLPVPELLGVYWERRALWVRGAIATRWMDNAETLGTWLAQSPENLADMLRDCGALIRRMHDLNVWHADLQVRNILVAPGGPYLIDFDNARLCARLTSLQRARNLLRLRRSLEKNRLSLDNFKPICEGYGIEALPAWLSRIYEGKGRLSDIAAGRNRDNE